MKYILCIILGITSFSGWAQDTTSVTTQNVQWNSPRFTDVLANVAVEKPCQFITHGSTTIDWIQKGGALVYSMSINSISGSWSNVSQDGSISYSVSYNDLTGTVSVSRSGSSMNIQLILHGANNDINNSYEISELAIQ